MLGSDSAKGPPNDRRAADPDESPFLNAQGDRPSDDRPGGHPPAGGPTQAAKKGAGEHGFYIPSLDGIRALSFLTVFLAHAGLGWLIPGYFGLTVFFFLSGYLITTLLRMELARDGAISLTQFYLRRTLRIFPPMYLVLTVACLLPLSGFVRGSVHLGTVLIQAAHLTNYYIISHGWWEGIAPGTWVYWSLAVEEHFYLGFPLFYIVLTRYVPSRGKQALVFAGICALILAWRCILIFGFHVWKDRVYLATDTRVDAILIGCILAVWRNPVLDRASYDRRAYRVLQVALPLGFLAVLVSVGVRVPEFEQTLRYTLQSVGLLPLFVAAILFHEKWPFRILNWAPVRYLGILSYSLYLMHTAALWAFEERTTWSPLVRGILVFTLIFGLAALMHRFVEIPSGKLRRVITRWMTKGREERRAKPMAA